jgi:hypothetical protein
MKHSFPFLVLSEPKQKILLSPKKIVKERWNWLLHLLKACLSAVDKQKKETMDLIMKQSEEKYKMGDVNDAVVYIDNKEDDGKSI